MKYFEEAVYIALRSYINEYKYVEEIGSCSRNEISKEMYELFQNQNGILCLENEKLIGYLVYCSKWMTNGTLWCVIPFWGYGALGQSRSKILSMLFQQLAEELCIEQKVHFEIKIYAHDLEIVQLFSFLQFGIQCEEGIRFIKQDISYNEISIIRELTNGEITKKWAEIWELLKRLIEHLHKSPVFYPGTEFTEEVYKDYLLDSNT